jgi:polysaccharide export outer membrane protein
MRKSVKLTVASCCLLAGLASGPAARAAAPAQAVPGTETPAPAPARTPDDGTPSDYVIGAEDVLGILVWREPDVSGDVTVRSDGRITLPLLGDLPAAGQRPEALAEHIRDLAAKYLTDPNVTVVVRQINSRKAFITGEVAAPGVYPLSSPLTVMQLIALAGGLKEFADQRAIRIMRMEDGRTKTIAFNYKWILEGKRLEQNILLKPGDTVVVP